MSRHIWKWQPDWARGVTERLQYRTDIQVTNTGRERRTRLRRHPRRGMAFQTVLAGADVRGVKAALWATDNDGWLVPIWWDVAVGEYVETSPGLWAFQADGVGKNRDWQVESDCVLTNGTTWATAQVVDVSDDFIGTSEPDEPIPGRVKIYPAFPAALLESDFSDVTAGASTVEISAELIGYRSPPGQPSDVQHYDLDVMTRQPNRERALDADVQRIIDATGTDYGRVNRYDDPGRPFSDLQSDHLLIGREEVWNDRLLFQHLGGAHRPFLRPTWNADVKFIEMSGSEMAIEPIRYDDNFSSGLGAFGHKVGRDHVYVRLRGEEYPGVVEYADYNGSEEWLSVAPYRPELTVSDVRQISWLELARLGSDLIEIDWITAGVARTSLPIRTLDADL